MANHVIQRVENQIVVQPLVAVPLTDLYSRLAANDAGLADEIEARSATDAEVAEVRVIAEAAITQAQLDATVIEVAGSSDAGLNALNVALSADIQALADNTYSIDQIDALNEGFAGSLAGKQPLSDNLSSLAGVTSSALGRSILSRSTPALARGDLQVYSTGQIDTLNVGIAGAIDAVDQDLAQTRTNLTGRIERSPVTRGPSLGFLPDDDQPVVLVTEDSSGRVQALAGPDAVARAVSHDGSVPVPEIPQISPLSRGPSLGFVPDTTVPVVEVREDAEGRVQALTSPTAETYLLGIGGVFDPLAVPARGPSFGFIPGTADPVVIAKVYRDGALDTAEGAYTGALVVGEGLLRRRPPLPTLDPVTFDALSSSVPVPAGEMGFPGDRLTHWADTTVTSPATATATVTDAAITAGFAVKTWLEYEQIVSVTSVLRTSDDAVRSEGTHYLIDMRRGLVQNLTSDALKITYVGSKSRKDIVSVDPRLAQPVVTLTQGTEKARNAHLYPPALPSGHTEIGRVSRKGVHALFIPKFKWRNGVHIDRLAEQAAALEYNRRALAPIRQRLITGERVRIIAHGNSRVSIGTGGNVDNLNTFPNSLAPGGDGTAWVRDVPSYFERYSSADKTLLGLDPAEAFTYEGLGYNMTGGSADGFGAVHVRAGYVWEMLKAIHRAYPNAVLDYRNWGLGGTNSGNTVNGSGFGNALWPTRWNAVKADIIAGETLFIPVDPMNEGGSSESYANWVQMVTEAQALGAVAHFMGAARPDPRSSILTAEQVSFSCREMARAAWDTGSAISDSWRILSPENLCGLGLTEDEMMDASLENHEGVPLQQAIGRDAALSYLT